MRRMLVPLVVLFAAAALAWLSLFDRMSPVAVALVEVESSFGFPLWPPFAVVGAVLLLVRLLHSRRGPSAPPPRGLTRDTPASRSAAPMPARAAEDLPPPQADVVGGWLAAIQAGARAVSDDPMGRVRFDDAAGVPIALVLTGVTREQARRRVAAYAAWLATIPTPPTARVRAVSSPDLQGPIAGLLRGELARHFPNERFHVTSTQDGADAVFGDPDPRWTR